MRTFAKLFLLIFIFALMVNQAYSHCQIPCGIYGDHTRFDMLVEHIQTIEKGMNQINELSKNSSANINQLVRWVNNKDEHADEFTEIVTYYFLAQRIKIADSQKTEEFADYQKKLTILHQMMVFSMKCKQTTDLKNVEELKSLVSQFEDIYFSPEQKEHFESRHKNN
ncbi:MAG: superoxide dismutase [Calditrichia bacterium]|nr:superoxide dismutase [Calditrichia bacterium]